MQIALEATNHFVLRQIVDEIILVPVSHQARQRNQLIVLNPSAAFIYEKIRAGLERDRVLMEMSEEFEGTKESFENDFDQFTKDLLSLEALREKASQN